MISSPHHAWILRVSQGDSYTAEGSGKIRVEY